MAFEAATLGETKSMGTRWMSSCEGMANTQYKEFSSNILLFEGDSKHDDVQPAFVETVLQGWKLA